MAEIRALFLISAFIQPFSISTHGGYIAAISSHFLEKIPNFQGFLVI